MEEAQLSKSEIGNFLRNNHRDAKEILCSFPPSLFVQPKTVLYIHQIEKAAAQHGWLSNLTAEFGSLLFYHDVIAPVVVLLRIANVALAEVLDPAALLKNPCRAVALLKSVEAIGGFVKVQLCILKICERCITRGHSVPLPSTPPTDARFPSRIANSWLTIRKVRPSLPCGRIVPFQFWTFVLSLSWRYCLATENPAAAPGSETTCACRTRGSATPPG